MVKTLIYYFAVDVALKQQVSVKTYLLDSVCVSGVSYSQIMMSRSNLTERNTDLLSCYLIVI